MSFNPGSLNLQTFLENPNSIALQPPEIQLTIASHPETPRALLQILTESEDLQVAETAKLHINWESIEDWQTELDTILQTAQLGQNDRLAVELLKIAPVPPVFLSKWVPADRLIQGLRNPHLPVRYRLQILKRLAEEETLEPRLQVAESGETPIALLESLVGDLELPIRLAAKMNPNCPAALVKLVEGQHECAANWETDTEQLGLLGQSRWGWVRLAVAQNPMASEASLRALATDRSSKIRLAVAQNPSTPSELLAELADCLEEVIQSAIAAHSNTSAETLLQLIPTQRSKIYERQNLPASILQQLYEDAARTEKGTNNIRYLLLKQANLPETILAAYAECSPEDIKRENTYHLLEIAKHPNVSIDILQKLAEYKSSKVRLAVAQSLRTPERLKQQLIERLSQDSDENIQAEIARDPNTPVVVLMTMAEREIYQPKLLNEIRRVLATEYVPNSHPYKSQAELDMALLKYQVLSPAGITVDVDRWMKIIETPDLLVALSSSESPRELEAPEWKTRMAFRLSDLLPELHEETIQQVAQKLCSILGNSNLDIKDRRSFHGVAIALLSNPTLPIKMHETLKHQLWRPERSHYHDSGFHQVITALILNPAISETERSTLIEQAISSSYGVPEIIIKHPDTPVSLLEHLFAGDAGDKQKVICNPNAPDYMFRELMNSVKGATRGYIAENPGAPIDVLVHLAKDSDNNLRIKALNNPSLPRLTRYQVELQLLEAEEVRQANEQLARRPNSPYALSQVVEKGDRNSKIMAARNLATPIAVLEQLAKDADDTVRSVVIENRNLPLQSLLELTQDQSVNIRANLARHRNNVQVPAEILERLAKDEDPQVRSQVASNPNTPSDLLTQLAQDPSDDVCHALVRNPNAPEIVLEIVGIQRGIVNTYNAKTPGTALDAAIERTLQADFRFRDKQLDEILKNYRSQIPATTLTRLANTCKTNWVRSSIAHHHNTPNIALCQMAEDEYSPILWGIARNPNASPELLEQLLDRANLSQQDYQQLCGAMVEREVIPENIIDRLYQTSGSFIRQSIVTRNNLSSDVLDRMIATEFDSSVLVPLARNPLLSAAQLAHLAQKSNPQVCIALINHPNLTPELWEQLSRYPEFSIRSAITAHLNCPQSVLEELLLTELFDSENAIEIRQKIAAHPNVTLEMLMQLANSGVGKIRSIVAAHPKTPLSLLEHLAIDEKVEVRRAVAQNPNTPEPLKVQLRDLIPRTTPEKVSFTLRGLSRLYNPQTDNLAELLSEYARSDNAFVRFVALLHPLTPVEALQAASQSLRWLERYAVAENPATPPLLRQQLTQDGNQIVRHTAVANQETSS
jgi:Leucine rich repeat variant